MRRLTTLMLCACMLFCLGTAARANILSLSCTGDNNAISWGSVTWGGTGTSNGWAHIAGTVSTAGSGTMITSVTANSTSDPTLSYTDTATNTGISSWSGYNVEVIVATPGTISLPTFTGATVITPTSGWSATPISGTLSFVGTSSGGLFAPPYGWAEYEDSISMNGSPSIGTGNSLVFSYTLNFGGSDQYLAYQIQSPAFQVVPEPGTMALLAGGGVASLCLWRRRRRSTATFSVKLALLRRGAIFLTTAAVTMLY